MKAYLIWLLSCAHFFDQPLFFIVLYYWQGVIVVCLEPTKHFRLVKEFGQHLFGEELIAMQRTGNIVYIFHTFIFQIHDIH